MTPENWLIAIALLSIYPLAALACWALGWGKKK